MIPYEEYLPLLPHEYSYALYLSYRFDLCMYDPMILNMVSQRYSRDEDYTSASASDSDSVTYGEDDFDFGDSQCVVPGWLFFEQEDEDASLLLHDNNNLEIVFGSFDQDSDLDMISAVPFLAIKPDFDESTIKIREIICPVAAIKQISDYGSSFNNDAAPRSPELDGNTTSFQSNTMEEIQNCFDCDSVSDCNNRTNDEARVDFSKMRSMFVGEIVNKLIVVELLTITNFILEAIAKPTHPNLELDWEKLKRALFGESLVHMPLDSPYFKIPLDAILKLHPLHINSMFSINSNDVDDGFLTFGVDSVLFSLLVNNGFSSSGTPIFVEYAKANSLLLSDHHMFVEMPLSNCFYTVNNNTLVDPPATFVKNYSIQWVFSILLFLGCPCLHYNPYVPNWVFKHSSLLWSEHMSTIINVHCEMRGILDLPCNDVGFINRLFFGEDHMCQHPVYRRTMECSIYSLNYGPWPPDSPGWFLAPFDPMLQLAFTEDRIIGTNDYISSGAMIFGDFYMAERFDVDIGEELFEVNKIGYEYLASIVDCKDVWHENCIFISMLINLDIHLVVVRDLNHSLAKMTINEISSVEKAPSQCVKCYFPLAKGSYDEVVKGCDGVSHVENSMEFSVVKSETIETLIQKNSNSNAFKGNKLELQQWMELFGLFGLLLCVGLITLQRYFRPKNFHHDRFGLGQIAICI